MRDRPSSKKTSTRGNSRLSLRDGKRAPLSHVSRTKVPRGRKSAFHLSRIALPRFGTPPDAPDILRKIRPSGPRPVPPRSTLPLRAPPPGQGFPNAARSPGRRIPRPAPAQECGRSGGNSGARPISRQRRRSARPSPTRRLDGADRPARLCRQRSQAWGRAAMGTRNITVTRDFAGHRPPGNCRDLAAHLAARLRPRHAVDQGRATC